VRDTGIPDKVVLGNLENDLFHILEALKPGVIALGYDQRVSEEALRERCGGCEIVRLTSYHPEKFKSSYYRNREDKI
jgi:glycerol-3-phosphate cytidylyltransferase-like family protein